MTPFTVTFVTWQIRFSLEQTLTTRCDPLGVNTNNCIIKEHTYVKFIAPLNNTHIYNENCRVYVKRMRTVKIKNPETNTNRCTNFAKTNKWTLEYMKVILLWHIYWHVSATDVAICRLVTTNNMIKIIKCQNQSTVQFWLNSQLKEYRTDRYNIY